MRLASQALPVGAYAYSQGLESAIDAGYVTSEEEAQIWIGELMEVSLARLDLPILERSIEAWRKGDIDRVIELNNLIAAFRETRELFFEDQQMGRALKRLMLDHGDARVAQWPASEVPGFVSMFSLAGAIYGISVSALLTAYTWSWMENQVGCATKLVPLGQSAAQRILIRLTPDVEDACKLALSLEEHEIGASLPGFAILSSQHEQQSTRLFRS